MLFKAQQASNDLINNSDVIAEITSNPEAYGLTWDELFDENGLITDKVQAAATKLALDRQRAAAVATAQANQEQMRLQQQKNIEETATNNINYGDVATDKDLTFTMSSSAGDIDYTARGSSLEDVQQHILEKQTTFSPEQMLDMLNKYDNTNINSLNDFLISNFLVDSNAWPILNDTTFDNATDEGKIFSWPSVIIQSI